MKKAVWLETDQLNLWDAFILEQPKGMIYHLSAWKDILEKSFSHIKGHFLAILENDEIIGGLPVYEVTSWLTGNRLVSIPFATFCDPMIFSREAYEAAWQSLTTLYERRHSSYLEVRARHCLYEETDFHARIAAPYRHHFLRLDREPKDLIESFSPHCRRNCRKALASKLNLHIGKTEHDLRDFFQIYMGTRRRLGLPPIPYKFFHTQWETLFPHNRIAILFAAYEGRRVAALYLSKFKDLAIIEAACDRIDYRSLRTNYFLYLQAIKMAHREGLSVLSFGRTHPQNSGLLAFKRGWGAHEEALKEIHFPETTAPTARQTSTSWKYRAITTLSRLIPNRLFNRYGELVYRHMG